MGSRPVRGACNAPSGRHARSLSPARCRSGSSSLPAGAAAPAPFSTPLRRQQYHAFHLALEPNPLAGLEATLKRSQVPVRMVWGASDDIFALADAEYLDRTFPQSRGIRRVADGKLFFQEEYPQVIAEEAKRLWGVG